MAAPDELGFFDRRTLDHSFRGRERANADRRLGGQDKLGDHSGRRSER
jgi:hypothetical protein